MARSPSSPLAPLAPLLFALFALLPFGLLRVGGLADLVGLLEALLEVLDALAEALADVGDAVADVAGAGLAGDLGHEVPAAHRAGEQGLAVVQALAVDAAEHHVRQVRPRRAEGAGQ